MQVLTRTSDVPFSDIHRSLMQKPVPAQGIVMLLEQVSRMIHGAGYAQGLYPAQWVALRYFAEVDVPARTASGLARFQDMSIAPVARTIRTLVDKGLLERRPNPRSRRADLIEVTENGRTLLRHDPRMPLRTLLEGLDGTRNEALVEALEVLVRELPRSSPFPPRGRRRT
jgi:DNA-binding MarR family transcriptional regulator